MGKRGGAGTILDEPDYETHNRIARALIRLCDTYGFETVLGVFSNGCEIVERKRHEREARKHHARV
jgi:hypothetical protein